MTAGALTGLITTRLRVHPLLAGILVMTALYSINLVILGRSNVPIETASSLLDTSVGSMQGPMMMAVAFGIAVIGITAWLLKTDFGIAMRATGNNEQMASANGVHVNRMKVIGLSLANGLTAISGYLLVQYQGFSDINMGVGIIVAGLAAVMIGESLSGLMKVRTLWLILGCLAIGSMLFRLVIAQSLVFGLNPNYLKLVTALIVLAIVVGTTRKNSRT
jgi:putative ABC transport system permease protein